MKNLINAVCDLCAFLGIAILILRNSSSSAKTKIVEIPREYQVGTYYLQGNCDYAHHFDHETFCSRFVEGKSVGIIIGDSTKIRQVTLEDGELTLEDYIDVWGVPESFKQLNYIVYIYWQDKYLWLEPRQVSMSSIVQYVTYTSEPLPISTPWHGIDRKVLP